MESKAGIFVAYLEPETAEKWPCWKLMIVQKRLVSSPWYLTNKYEWLFQVDD